MSIAFALLPKRDGKDIGFCQLPKSNEVHYFRSHARSNLAVSHCGLVILKQDLLETVRGKFCRYCMMIEQQRDERKV